MINLNFTIQWNFTQLKTLIVAIEFINLSTKKTSHTLISSGANAMSFQVSSQHCAESNHFTKVEPINSHPLRYGSAFMMTSIRDSYSASSLNTGIMRLYHSLILKVILQDWLSSCTFQLHYNLNDLVLQTLPNQPLALRFNYHHI